MPVLALRDNGRRRVSHSPLLRWEAPSLTGERLRQNVRGENSKRKVPLVVVYWPVCSSRRTTGGLAAVRQQHQLTAVIGQKEL